MIAKVENPKQYVPLKDKLTPVNKLAQREFPPYLRVVKTAIPTTTEASSLLPEDAISINEKPLAPTTSLVPNKITTQTQISTPRNRRQTAFISSPHIQESQQMINDPEFIAGLADKNNPNWTVLDEKFGGAIFSLALRILHNSAEAEEIKQEVLLKCFRSVEGYDSKKGKFASWLLSITHHACIDVLRRRRARPFFNESDNPLAFQHAQSPHNNIEKTEHAAWKNQLRQELTTLLFKLPPDQRRVVEEHYINGRTHVEIAEILKEPLGTVKTRLRLALEKLHSMKDQIKSHE